MTVSQGKTYTTGLKLKQLEDFSQVGISWPFCELTVSDTEK